MGFPEQVSHPRKLPTLQPPGNSKQPGKEKEESIPNIFYTKHLEKHKLSHPFWEVNKRSQNEDDHLPDMPSDVNVNSAVNHTEENLPARTQSLSAETVNSTEHSAAGSEIEELGKNQFVGRSRLTAKERIRFSKKKHLHPK